MRITAKGQVTIPAEIRARAGLLPGTDVEFLIEDGVVRIVARRPSVQPGTRGRKVLRSLRGATKVRRTTDEIMAITRLR